MGDWRVPWTFRCAGHTRRTATSVVVAVAALLLTAGCGGPGVASGTAPSAPTLGGWRVVALGDSVTAGAACDCTAYPQAYGKDLTRLRGVPTVVVNRGTDGLDSSHLLAQVRNPSSPDSKAVAAADIDLVTIGANDFSDHHTEITHGTCAGDEHIGCVASEITQMQHNVTAILDQIRKLRHGLPTAVLVTGYWNVFEDGEVARSAFPDSGTRASLELTKRVNTAIRRAASTSDATYVDLLAVFNGPAADGDITNLLAPDGDHPNAKGQALIADRLVAAALPGLAP